MARLSTFVAADRIRCGLRWVRRRRLPPLVAWTLTHRCNYCCDFCGCRRQPAAEVGPARALALARHLVESGVMAVSLLGGEVLLREDLGDVIGVLVAGGVAVRITTNGRLVPSRAHVLDGVSCVKMSLDGPRDVHDALRGEGAFAAVLEAVQACRQRGIRVQVNTVLTRRLLPRLDEHLETASRLGARVTFQVPELRAGAAARDLAGILPDPDRLREALAKLAGHVQGGDRRIGSSEGTLRYMLAWPEMEPVDCWAGLLFCRVLVDGSIRACDRTYAPVPAGRTLARVGPCRGCYRNNTIEINRAVAGGLDALRALARLL